MAKTLAYAAAMFLVASRGEGASARGLAMIATLIVVVVQFGSATLGNFAPLPLGRGLRGSALA